MSDLGILLSEVASLQLTGLIHIIDVGLLWLPHPATPLDLHCPTPSSSSLSYWGHRREWRYTHISSGYIHVHRKHANIPLPSHVPFLCPLPHHFPVPLFPAGQAQWGQRPNRIFLGAPEVHCRLHRETQGSTWYT